MPQFKTEVEEQDETEIVAILGDTYFEHKRLKEELAARRIEFFEEASSSFKEEELAKKTVEVPKDQLASPVPYALRYNPGWRLVGFEEDYTFDETLEVDACFVTIQEDPEWKPYVASYAFPTPRQIVDGEKVKTLYGYVISKTIVDGSMMLDDERLIALDPDFYEEITQWVNLDLINRIGIDDYYLKSVDWPRELRNMEDLTVAQRGKVQTYLFEGPKTVRLLVRYAKQDEV